MKWKFKGQLQTDPISTMGLYIHLQKSIQCMFHLQPTFLFKVTLIIKMCQKKKKALKFQEEHGHFISVTAGKH